MQPYIKNKVIASPPAGAPGALTLRDLVEDDLPPIAMSKITGMGTNYIGYGSGSAYNITATPALLSLGTAVPRITIVAAGLYVIMATANIVYNGATLLANRTVTLKLRRTNNTAADIPNSSRSLTTGVLTLITANLSALPLPNVFYQASAGDIIEVWGSINVLPTVGNVQCDSADIVALRIG